MKFTAYDHIERWEGLRLKAYRDIAGVWTIGYGHTGKFAKPNNIITKEEAKTILDSDLAIFEANINKVVKVPINQNQYNALVSLAFNIGNGAFNGSTVLKRLNKGDYIGAADAILMWNKARVGGNLQVVQGLVNRRHSEKELFLSPTTNDIEITPILPDMLLEADIKNILNEAANTIIQRIKHEYT